MTTTSFKQSVKQTSGPYEDDYLWSTPGNWTNGVPMNGEDVTEAAAGVDTFSTLILNDLALLDSAAVYVMAGELTVDDLAGTTGTALLADSTTGATATVEVADLSIVGADLGAKGAGALYVQGESRDPGDVYIADDGGLVELESTPSSASTLQFVGSATIALFDAAPTTASKLDIQTGDVLEVSASAVSEVTFGASAITIVTPRTTYQFTDVVFDDAITGWVAYADPRTGLEAIAFGGDDTFQAVNKSTADDYLWSNSGNWKNSVGVPVNGDNVIVGTISVDDISKLDLDSLTISGTTEVEVTVGALTVGTVNISGGSDDGLLAGVPGADESLTPVTVTVNAVTGAGGVFAAAGPSARFYDNATSSAAYLVGAIEGGFFELAATPSPTLEMEVSPDSILALAQPGAFVTARWIGFAADEALELPGSAVTSVSMTSSSLTITTNLATTLFSSVSHATGDTVDGYVAFGDATTGLEEIYFEDNSSTSISETDASLWIGNGQANIAGGGDTINFEANTTNAIDLIDTASNWDLVSGSNVSVDLTTAQASIVGGADNVDFVAGASDAASLYNTGGDWDGVTAANGTVYFTSAQASVFGGGDSLYFVGGSNNAASLYKTANDWDNLVGSNGTIYLTSAQTSISGEYDAIYFVSGAGNAASLYNTDNDWDSVSGNGGEVYLTSSQASVFGEGDGVNFVGGTGDATSLYDTSNDWDTVIGSSGTIYLTSAQASVFGGLDIVDFASGTGNAVSLYDTAGVWDTVNGASGTVYITSAQASVVGGGDTIDLAGSGDIAALASTGSAGDVVSGSNATLDLYGVTASVTGSTDTLNFFAGDTATLSGGSDHLAFQQGIGGQDSIAGFASSDVIQLSKSDFANFAALSSHLTQSGANALITLNASDTITLTGVTASSLTAAEFSFV